MELVPTDKNDREKYEELLLKRDDCRKKAGNARIRYIRQFGALINASFQKQVDCIEKKKSIEFIQAKINHGEQVNGDELRSCLDETMKEYREHLQRMLDDYENCKKAEVVPEQVAQQVKTLYRKIAKLIHPDMNPDLAENPVFDDLWERVTAAYQGSDLETMQELEVLVHKALEENGRDPSKIQIPDLKEKIEAVQKEIDKIISTDPYLYDELLNDPEAVSEKKNSLQAELDSYVEYEKQLDQIIEELLKGGFILSWPMN